MIQIKYLQMMRPLPQTVRDTRSQAAVSHIPSSHRA